MLSDEEFTTKNKQTKKKQTVINYNFILTEEKTTDC